MITFVGATNSLTTQFQVPAGVAYGTQLFAQSVALIAPNSLPNGQNAFRSDDHVRRGDQLADDAVPGAGWRRLRHAAVRAVGGADRAEQPAERPERLPI